MADKDYRECSECCDCGEPTSFTITIGDDPPIFVVNVGRLEAIEQRWNGDERLADPRCSHSNIARRH